MMITAENMVSPIFQLPPISRDTHDLNRGIWSIYKCLDFNHQAIPGRFIEAFVDDGYIELFCTIKCDVRTFELIRKPPNSKAELTGIRVPFDVPGLYTVRITLARAWGQEIRIAAFPREAEKHLGYQERSQALQRRLRLRAICRDERVTDESVIASLEGGDPELSGMGGKIVGLGLPLLEGAGAGGHQTFSVNQYNA